MSEISRQYQRTESFDEPSSAFLTGPVIAYKVYAGDGGMEAVRGLAFDEVSIRTLRNIHALGKEPALTNTGQAVGPGMYYRMAIVTPNILVEETEFKASSASEPRMVGAPINRDHRGRCDSGRHLAARCSFPSTARVGSPTGFEPSDLG